MARKKRTESDALVTPGWRPHGALTIEDVAAAWPEARAAATGDALVDLSALERIDTAGVQLLLALRRQVESRGGTWRLVGCAPRTLELIQTLGGAQALGVTETSAASLGDRS